MSSSYFTGAEHMEVTKSYGFREVVCNEDGEWSPKLITDCICKYLYLE